MNLYELTLGLLVKDRYVILNHGLDEVEPRTGKEAHDELCSNFSWMNDDEISQRRVKSILARKNSFADNEDLVLSEMGEIEMPRGGVRSVNKYLKSSIVSKLEPQVNFGYSCMLDQEIGDDFTQLLNASGHANHQSIVTRVKILNEAARGPQKAANLMQSAGLNIGSYNKCKEYLEDMKLITVDEVKMDKTGIPTATRFCYSIAGDFPEKTRNFQVKRLVYETLEEFGSQVPVCDIVSNVQVHHPEINRDAIRKAIKTLTGNGIIERKVLNSEGTIHITDRGLQLAEIATLPLRDYVQSQEEFPGYEQFQEELSANLYQILLKAESRLV